MGQQSRPWDGSHQSASRKSWSAWSAGASIILNRCEGNALAELTSHLNTSTTVQVHYFQSGITDSGESPEESDWQAVPKVKTEADLIKSLSKHHRLNREFAMTVLGCRVSVIDRFGPECICNCGKTSKSGWDWPRKHDWGHYVEEFGDGFGGRTLVDYVALLGMRLCRQLICQHRG
jgi:hypothetical protein